MEFLVVFKSWVAGDFGFQFVFELFFVECACFYEVVAEEFPCYVVVDGDDVADFVEDIKFFSSEVLEQLDAFEVEFVG